MCINILLFSCNTEIQNNMIKLIRSLFLIIIIGFPKLLTACATCYGAAGAPDTNGLNMAILVLLAFTASMLSLIVFTTISIYKRSKTYRLELKNTYYDGE
jgi:hypothetical protein